ncbi:hypothetical protein ACIQF6_24555 [Kitasatospora sp. NPDC092948]|uniref:hypothetical protein n=1 Tax=Kitasatospora sp. NPDC092948 TaxID=3364088 RepID=UPI00380E3A37
MRESDRSGAVAGFRAAASGVGIGLCLLLLGWGFTALRGDGHFPFSATAVVAVPVSNTMGRLWQRWPENRRPATVVAMATFLLVAFLSAGIGDSLGMDPGPEQDAGPDGMTLGFIPGALLAGTLFGALAGDPAPRATYSWVRFAGRSRRFHRVVYGGLAVLFAATVTVGVMVG